MEVHISIDEWRNETKISTHNSISSGTLQAPFLSNNFPCFYTHTFTFVPVCV